MSANVTQQQQTDKRGVVTISFYVHGNSYQELIAKATKFTRDLNKKEDCSASVDSITESKPGQIGIGRKIL